MPTLMKPGYRTPRELVEGLQQQTAGARGRLWEAVRGPIDRLMGELIARHGLTQEQERLTLYALHLAETWLRTRPAREFDRHSWEAFRNAAVLHVARMALLPFGGRAPSHPSPDSGGGQGGGGGPAPLPDCPVYQNETFSLPYERVGGFWFGGDWYGGRHAADGALWVMVADVTGHGYYAYLLAGALPGVWEACWKAVVARSPDRVTTMRPADLLRAMHDLLETCLPEGVYAECTLVRLGAEGDATVAPAGGSRLLLRRGGGPPDLLKLRGGWLGLFPPSPADEKTWRLDAGDELLLGSDGAFDHLPDPDADDLAARLNIPASASLLDDVRGLLREALRNGPQKDDITLVLLRRRAGRSPQSDGADDVPV